MTLIRPTQKSSQLLILLLLRTPASAFVPASPAVALRVTGEVRDHLDLSVGDLAAFHQQTIHVTDEKGVPAEYAGVPVAKILEKAGAPLGKEMKGASMGVRLVARAPDGYHVLFALAEFDPAFNDRVILLADRRGRQATRQLRGPVAIRCSGRQAPRAMDSRGQHARSLERPLKNQRDQV